MSKVREMAKYTLRYILTMDTMEPLTERQGSRRTSMERALRHKVKWTGGVSKQYNLIWYLQMK